jgi:uncharacterized protein (DUF302 family)
MMIEAIRSIPRYALSRTVPLSFEDAERRIRAALAAEGFGVLTEIDVSATLAKKLNVLLPRHTILGACAPPLAYRALQAEPEIGLLLPCNVVVRVDARGATVIEAIDPVVQLGVSENVRLQPVAEEVRARLLRALDRAAA